MDKSLPTVFELGIYMVDECVKPEYNGGGIRLLWDVIIWPH